MNKWKWSLWSDCSIKCVTVWTRLRPCQTSSSATTYKSSMCAKIISRNWTRSYIYRISPDWRVCGLRITHVPIQICKWCWSRDKHDCLFHRVCLIAVDRNVCFMILYTFVFDLIDLWCVLLISVNCLLYR